MKLINIKHLSSIFICIMALLIASCGNTATQMVKWKNKKAGLKEWEKTIDNGITTVTHYYESGMKKKEEQFKGLERHGKSYQWFENGLLEFEKNFEHGIKAGNHKRYYSNGQLSINQFFEKGFKSGVWTFYLKNGQKWRKESYNEGSLASAEKFISLSLE